jgi:DNA-binding transcriptional ArsR family regulator
MNVEQAAKQLEALGNPTRLQVYRTLVRAGHAGLPVSRVQERLGIPASTLSHHLHRLILTGARDAGASGHNSDLPGELLGHGRSSGLHA